MSIRKPVKADPDVLTAFEDVQEELDELATMKATIAGLTEKVKELTDRLDAPEVIPTFDKVPGDLHVDGNLRVDGAVDIRGDLSAPGQLDGIAGAVPESVTGASGTRILQVNGSLAVLGATSTANLRAQNAQVYGDIHVGGKHGGGVTVLYTRASTVTSAASETTAGSVYVDADKYMAKDGDLIRIEQWGTITTSTFSMKSYYGSASIVSWTDIGYGIPFLFRVTTDIMRTGAATQSLRSQVNAYYAGGGSSYNYTATYVSGGVTNSGLVLVKTTLTDAGTDLLENACVITALSSAV